MSKEYNVSGVLPDGVLDTLPAGTNIAVVGPAMTGKREIALKLLAAGYEEGDGILCITTDSARTVCTDLEQHVETLDRNRVGVVDTANSDGQQLLDATVERASSPSDLTGISIGTSKLYEHFEKRGITGIRYGLISISTLLQYMDAPKVFRFLHIYTKRIGETGGLGVYTLDDDSHDKQVVNTITGQFDGIVQLRETDAGTIEFRLRGFGRQSTPWQSL